MHALDQIPLRTKGGYNPIIETPRGSTVKFAYDRQTGMFVAKKKLPIRLSFPFAAKLPHKIEVEAVLERSKNSASLRAGVSKQDRCRQMLGIRVDREPEEDELQQRDAKHHPEGHSIAPHLRELLHDDPHQTRE